MDIKCTLFKIGFGINWLFLAEKCCFMIASVAKGIKSVTSLWYLIYDCYTQHTDVPHLTTSIR